jgi:hypothetical protein
MRRTSRSFRKEATRDPFELELEPPEVAGPDDETPFVTFRDPGKLPAESAFDMARMNDPEVMLRKLLSEDDFATFWAEWRTRPVDELNDLIDDVMEHYGAERGKPRR